MHIESILAIRDVGIQVKTTYWGGSSVSRFINRNKIDDVIINEGISFWQIKSYMAILVKDEDKMVVVFEVSLHIPYPRQTLITQHNTTASPAKAEACFTTSLPRHAHHHLYAKAKPCTRLVLHLKAINGIYMFIYEYPTDRSFKATQTAAL